MEIRARYTMMGAFTLGIILAGFAFVYWLNSAGGLGQRAYFRVAFDSPVSGLLRGSGVLFNGIRVGEITNLTLDPEKPGTVAASIAIDLRTPVRADTRVGIEFQGLTGAPVISLVGGSSAAPPIAKANEAGGPLLIAEKNAGQSMTQAARDVLRRFDGVLAENSEPLRDTIANIRKFSEALARNSDKVDSIVSGVERLTGGGTKQQARIFDLPAASSLPALPKVPAGQLVVAEPTTLLVYDSDKIVVRSSGDDAPTIERAQWPDMLPKVVQARLVQSFENAGYAKVLGRAPDAVKPGHQLLIEIRAFHIVREAQGTAVEVELAARIMDGDGRILGNKVFRQRDPLASIEAAAAASALGEAFRRIASDLVPWACALI